LYIRIQKICTYSNSPYKEYIVRLLSKHETCREEEEEEEEETRNNKSEGEEEDLLL
jgi:hypothetical protein